MAYTARKLITRSWYLSGIVARNLQDVTGDQATDGLDLLNSLLGFKQVETDLVPYFKYLTTISTVPGQEEYFIENVSIIQSATFDYGTVRFPLTELSASQYLASARVNNIVSLPYSYMQQRVDGGTIFRLYFNPQDSWQLNLYCKMFLANVDLDTDLELTFDAAYIEYLRWYLAKYMCLEYGIEFGDGKIKQLRELTSQLQYLSPPEAMVSKVSILQGNAALGWGFVNLFRGWVP